MVTIRNRLAVLLADKEFREGRRIKLAEVAHESGVGLSTIKSYLSQSDPVTRFDADIVAKLCKYLDCGVNDLLVIVEDEKRSLSHRNTAEFSTIPAMG